MWLRRERLYRPTIMPRRSRLTVLIVLVGVVAIAGLGIAWGPSLLGATPTPDGRQAAGTPGPATPTATPDPSDQSPTAAPSTTRASSATASPSSSAIAGPLPPPPAPPSADVLARQLERRLAALRVQHGIPGISATILFADGSEWNGADGVADVAAGRPVRNDTAFSIASMSKTFTAALVIDLVDEGRLRLDESAAPHLPGVKVNRAITIRMLLDHTSGLSDYFLSPTIDRALTADRNARWDARRALTFVGAPYFPPGKGWRYSNTNYLLLGLVVEGVTARSIAAEVRERFLDPLELESMSYQGVEKARTVLARGYRFASASTTARPVDVGDRSGIAPYRALVTASGAAGSLAGTSADVARWGRELYAGDALSAAARALMVEGVAATSPLRPVIPYGLGVQAIPIGGFASLGHSGRFSGFRGVLRYLPAEDVAIAILTNQSRMDPNLLVPEFLRVLYPDPGACNPCATRS